MKKQQEGGHSDYMARLVGPLLQAAGITASFWESATSCSGAEDVQLTAKQEQHKEISWITYRYLGHRTQN